MTLISTNISLTSKHSSSDSTLYDPHTSGTFVKGPRLSSFLSPFRNLIRYSQYRPSPKLLTSNVVRTTF